MSVAGGHVKRGIPSDVAVVRVKRDPTFPMFKEMSQSFEAIVFSSHEHHIFMILVGSLHIGAMSFQEIDHVSIPVETGQVKCTCSFIILNIYPGFELIFKRGVVATLTKVLAGEGLKVENVDFEFGEFVAVGSKVKESRSIFLAHEG